MDWLLSIFEKVKDAITLIGTSQVELLNSVDQVQFNENFIVSRILSNIHYITGTPSYLMLILSLQLGVGFMIWSCLKAILSITSKLTPRVGGKIKF